MAVFLVLSTSFLFVHESTHLSVFKDYQCEQTSLGTAPEKGMALYTSARECPKENMEKIVQAQDTVEAVGYQLFLIHLVLSLLTSIYMYNEELIT